jgi:hypothetical protein
MRNPTIDLVRQRLSSGEFPTRNDIEKLLTIIDQLQVECQQKHKLILQAQTDQNAYHILIAAHDVLVSAHNDLVAAYERIGLCVTNRNCGQGFSWCYQWEGEEGEDWHAGYASPAEAVEAGLRARLEDRIREAAVGQPTTSDYEYHQAHRREWN